MEVRAVERLRALLEALDHQPRRADGAARPPGRGLQVAADHQSRHRRRRLGPGVALGHHPAAAQDRRAVAERLDLLQLVADVEDRDALRGEPPQGLEQALGLLRGQDRGRLVHDQKLRVLKQAADDLDPLALTDRKRVDVAARIERQAVGLRDRANALGELPEVAGPIHAQGDVLQHGHGLEQGEVLEHHAYAEAARCPRVGHRDLFAVPQDGPLVGMEHAVDHLDQRALAGAVLAQERMDLARRHGKVDTVVCQDPGEALRDAAHREPRGNRRGLAAHGAPSFFTRDPRHPSPATRRHKAMDMARVGASGKPSGRQGVVFPPSAAGQSC